MLTGNVWPMKQPNSPSMFQKNMFQSVRDVPPINRRDSDEQIQESQQQMQLQETNYSEKQEELKSYMDTDFNPMKRHKFLKDNFLTTFNSKQISPVHSSLNCNNLVKDQEVRSSMDINHRHRDDKSKSARIDLLDVVIDEIVSHQKDLLNSQRLVTQTE